MFPISSWPLDERLTSQERSEKIDSEVLEVEFARAEAPRCCKRSGAGRIHATAPRPARRCTGPYWYIYIKMNGRTGSKYIGKNNP
jgi:hypothetical protein